MKKIYIQPSIEFEAIETSDILESSWRSEGEGFDGETEPDFPGTELGGGSSEEFAKGGSFDFEEEF
ncbi:MAG: hypothetical protein KBT34_07470 [Prevotella sp.]|nr:hypothetical protein [Candidatus Prevotella equi]